jgi:hypothetical protein
LYRIVTKKEVDEESKKAHAKVANPVVQNQDTTTKKVEEAATKKVE